MQKRDILNREFQGIAIEQRRSDGYVNATAMSKAHLAATGQSREVKHWLGNVRTQQTIEHLSLKVGIPTFRLIEIRKGRYGGTFIHPKLAIRFGMWLSDEFGYLVEEWIAEWMTTGKNPLTQAEAERIEYRDALKDESRLRLTDQVKHHLCRIKRYTKNRWRNIYFARVNDAINLLITGETSKTMRERLSQILGRSVSNSELIRDYFPAIVLQRYIAVCEAAANLMREGLDPLDAVQRAAKLVLPANYQPTQIDFTIHIKIVRRKAG